MSAPSDPGVHLEPGNTDPSVPRGRTVLVTGGNRGIGLACARRFQANGDRVAVTYRSAPPPELEVPGGGGDLFPVVCDVTSPEDVAAAFDRVEATLGPVEILVANAGITRDTLLLRMDETAWLDVIDTNLTGVYRVVRRALGPMLRSRRGRVVLISSVVGFLGSAGQVNYGAAKAGLVGLARSLAREVGSRGITANVVAPGIVETDMIAVLGDQRRAQLESMVPLGRTATADEVAGAVLFLASADAAYITGTVLPVDGGLAMGL